MKRCTPPTDTDMPIRYPSWVHRDTTRINRITVPRIACILVSSIVSRLHSRSSAYSIPSNEFQPIQTSEQNYNSPCILRDSFDHVFEVSYFPNLPMILNSTMHFWDYGNLTKSRRGRKRGQDDRSLNFERGRQAMYPSIDSLSIQRKRIIRNFFLSLQQSQS